MSVPNYPAGEGAIDIGTSNMMAVLVKALGTATEGDKDKIRRELGIPNPEALTAGNGQAPGTTATSETTPVRPFETDNQFSLSKVSSGIIVGIIATLLAAFIVYSLTNISTTMEARFNTMEARFNTMEARFSGLETRLDNRIFQLYAQFDALNKTVSDIRVDIGKLQALTTGQLAPA
jgi:Flp pilus assembly pilin Flp